MTLGCFGGGLGWAGLGCAARAALTHLTHTPSVDGCGEGSVNRSPGQHAPPAQGAARPLSWCIGWSAFGDEASVCQGPRQRGPPLPLHSSPAGVHVWPSSSSSSSTHEVNASLAGLPHLSMPLLHWTT